MRDILFAWEGEAAAPPSDMCSLFSEPYLHFGTVTMRGVLITRELFFQALQRSSGVLHIHQSILWWRLRFSREVWMLPSSRGRRSSPTVAVAVGRSLLGARREEKREQGNSTFLPHIPSNWIYVPRERQRAAPEICQVDFEEQPDLWTDGQTCQPYEPRGFRRRRRRRGSCFW